MHPELTLDMDKWGNNFIESIFIFIQSGGYDAVGCIETTPKFSMAFDMYKKKYLTKSTAEWQSINVEMKRTLVDFEPSTHLFCDYLNLKVELVSCTCDSCQKMEGKALDMIVQVLMIYVANGGKLDMLGVSEKIFQECKMAINEKLNGFWSEDPTHQNWEDRITVGKAFLIQLLDRIDELLLFIERMQTKFKHKNKT